MLSNEGFNLPESVLNGHVHPGICDHGNNYQNAVLANRRQVHATQVNSLQAGLF